MKGGKARKEGREEEGEEGSSFPALSVSPEGQVSIVWMEESGFQRLVLVYKSEITSSVFKVFSNPYLNICLYPVVKGLQCLLDILFAMIYYLGNCYTTDTQWY